jgi:protein-S-isoprenylcysteine O-methyltransferase Ste14
MVFCAAHMTGDRLAFAIVTTGYLVAAIPWEERSLRQSFGEGYDRYTNDVKWRMIPFIY